MLKAQHCNTIQYRAIYNARCLYDALLVIVEFDIHVPIHFHYIESSGGTFPMFLGQGVCDQNCHFFEQRQLLMWFKKANSIINLSIIYFTPHVFTQTIQAASFKKQIRGSPCQTERIILVLLDNLHETRIYFLWC